MTATALLAGLATALGRLGQGFGSRAPRDLAARIAAAGLSLPAGDLMAVKCGAAR